MPAVVCLLCLLAYALGYRIWGRFLARQIFRLDPTRLTPALLWPGIEAGLRLRSVRAQRRLP